MSDTTDITQLVLRERQGRDRGWWKQMADCFHPDSLVSLSWITGSGADFVAGSEAMSRSGPRQTHRLSPAVVQVNGTRSVVELGAAIELRLTINEVEADLASFVRLLYRAELRDSRWRILSLHAIYERDTLTAVLPGTTLDLDQARLAQFRAPYRFLGYHLSVAGRSVRDDLYGDDRPDDVDRLYAEAFAWMGGETGGPDTAAPP